MYNVLIRGFLRVFDIWETLNFKFNIYNWETIKIKLLKIKFWKSEEKNFRLLTNIFKISIDIVKNDK